MNLLTVTMFKYQYHYEAPTINTAIDETAIATHTNEQHTKYLVTSISPLLSLLIFSATNTSTLKGKMRWQLNAYHSKEKVRGM
jgi:hypothetical protein